MVITGKMAKQYLESNTVLLHLLDSEQYELFLTAVKDEYRGHIVMAMYDTGILAGKMSYTVYKDSQHGVKTMLCDEYNFTPIEKWAHQHVGTNNYWYITNDLTGEVVYINEA
jgi:hypothetical protein